MALLELIIFLIRRAAEVRASRRSQSLSTGLLTQDTDELMPPKKASRAKRLGIRVAIVAFTLSAAADLFSMLNGIVRPFVILLAPEAAFWWTVALAIYTLVEFLVRSVIYTLTSDAAPWKHSYNPALTATKSLVSAVQIAALIDASSLWGLSTALILGFFILSLRQLKNMVDSTQIQYAIVLTPAKDASHTCTSAKAGNTFGRILEVLTAGVTLAYAIAGIFRFLSQALGNNLSLLATLTSSGAFLLLGGLMSSLVFLGTRSQVNSLSYKCGKVLSVIDNLLHNIPVQFLLTSTTLFNLYVVSQTQSTENIHIPDWMTIFTFTFAAVRAVFISMPVAAFQGLLNFKTAARQYEVQSANDLRVMAAVVTPQKQRCSAGCSAFWTGGERLDSRELPVVHSRKSLILPDSEQACRL